MNKSFKDMTTEEKATVKGKILKATVSDEEVTKFDPMIHKLIKQEILRYWGNGLHVYSGDTMIGRLGMSFSDLMQYGRMLVCNQIRWYKTCGLGPSGKPRNAKMTTLIHQQLRNKFMSLSKSFASEKNGGQIINVESNKTTLQMYLDSIFDASKDLSVNKYALQVALAQCTKDLQKKCSRHFKSNAELSTYLHRLLASMDSVSHVSYEDIEGFSVASSDMNPEAALLFKEVLDTRMKELVAKRGGPVSLNDLVKKKRHTTPNFFPKGTSTLLMNLAREKGIESQKELAEQLGIGMTTLSNIIRGRSRGTAEFRAKLEKRFGKTFDELLAVVKG